MTLSLRASGHASVRGTPARTDAVVGSWALADLGTAATTGQVSGTISSAEAQAAAAELGASERASLIDEGYARGLADGEQKASLAAQARINEGLAVIDAITAQLRDAVSVAPAVLEENIAALAVIVARQIVARAVSVERDAVADLVRRALTEFPIDQSVRIRVNPLDLSLLTMNESSGNGAPITGSRDASWVADPRISRGGCLLEGRDRIIDGRIDTALERAYHRMAQIDAA